MKALAVVLREEFDAPFRFYDAATGGPIVVPGQEDAATTAAPGEREAALELAAEERPKVIAAAGGRLPHRVPAGRLRALATWSRSA